MPSLESSQRPRENLISQPRWWRMGTGRGTDPAAAVGSLVATTFSHTLPESQHLVSGPSAIVWSLTDQLGVVCLLFKLAGQVPSPVQSQPWLQDRPSRGKPIHPVQTLVRPTLGMQGRHPALNQGCISVLRSHPRLTQPCPQPALPQPGRAGRGCGLDIVTEASQKGRADA